jgi:hypothetical protein
MKLQKLVDRDKGIDTYVIRIKHDEATEAFKAMTIEERGMLHDLQHAERISIVLKALIVWIEKIEETKRRQGRPVQGHKPHYEG